SLYPALHRMEQQGWIKAEWKTSENNRRARYYSLTREGRKQLEAQEQTWETVTRAVAAVLKFS
ncbi:MAG TPA: helix-turn-helix transcriptional regulator, partial [Candidatus Acidoferrales bacterium]|nr:helix-turn-helix transcriptional regulator [Candidatus Acidoferrales bacterium]